MLGGNYLGEAYLGQAYAGATGGGGGGGSTTVAPPQLRSTTFYSVRGSGTATPAVPAGAAIGDVMIALVIEDNNTTGTFSTPSGWTQLDQKVITAQGQVAAVFWKRLTAADTGTYTFTFSVGSGVDITALINCFVSVDPGTDPAITSVNAVNTLTSSPVSVSANGFTANLGDTSVFLAAIDQNGQYGPLWGVPSGYTLAAAGNNNLWADGFTAYQTGLDAGATGTITGTVTNSGLSAGYDAWLVQLAGVPSVTTPVLWSTSYDNSSSSTPTPSVPLNAAIGDVMVAHVSVDNASATITAPSGWTLLASSDITSPDGQTFAVYWKRLTAVDTGTYAFTASSGETTATVICIRNADPSNPPTIGTVTQNTSSNSFPFSYTAVGVTALAGDLIILGVALDAVAKATPVWTNPTGFVGGPATTGPANYYSPVYTAIETNVAAGATGTVTASVDKSSSGSSAGYISYLVRVPEVPGGGGSSAYTGTAALSGSGSLSGGAPALTGTATLSGSGSLSASAVVPGTTPTVVSSFNTTAAGGSMAITLDSGTAVGDLIVVVGYVEPANEAHSGATFGTFTLPSIMNLATGFPIETDPSTITTTDDHRMYVWYGYATTAGTQTLTFTNSAGIYWGLAGGVVRGGPTSGQPFSETSTAVIAHNATGVTASPAVSLTLAAANSLVLWAYTDWDGANPGAPSGYTLVNAASNVAGQPGVWRNNYASSGSTGTVTGSRGGAEDGMGAALLSLRAPATSPAYTGTAAMSGSGTLSASMKPAEAAAATLSGSGSLSVSMKPAEAATATLSGSGTLTAAAMPATTAAATLSGSGTLSAIGVVVSVAVATLSGLGTLVAGAVPVVLAAATLSGTGTLTAAVTLAIAKAVALSGTGTLTVATAPALAATTALSGAGTLTAAPTPHTAAAAALTGSGTLAAVASAPKILLAVALSGSGELIASSSSNPATLATLSGTGTLAAATGALTIWQTVALGGTGSLTVGQKVATFAIGTLSGVGVLAAVVAVAVRFSSALSGSGTLTASDAPHLATAATLSGAGTLVATGGGRSAGPATLSGNGALTVTQTGQFQTTGALTGSGVLTASATAPGIITSVDLAGSGALTVGFHPGLVAAAALSGAGSLVTNDSAGLTDVATLGSEGTLTATVTTTFAGTGSFSGSGLLTTVGVAQQVRASYWTGTSPIPGVLYYYDGTTEHPVFALFLST